VRAGVRCRALDIRMPVSGVCLLQVTNDTWIQKAEGATGSRVAGEHSAADKGGRNSVGRFQLEIHRGEKL
jgi:hypothetical protein